MQRDDALAFACGSLCLQVHSVLPLAMQPLSIRHGPVMEGSDLFTWLAKGARYLTVIKTGAGTRVYDHADDMLYYANPNTELLRECPDGHAFLCQTVCDRWEDGTLTPRLLVMDMVCPRIECPRARGDTLRRLGHVFPPAYHVQWAGEKAALEGFVGSGVVPHDVEGVVALREPLQVIRECSHPIEALQAFKTGL